MTGIRNPSAGTAKVCSGDALSPMEIGVLSELGLSAGQIDRYLGAWACEDELRAVPTAASNGEVGR